MIRYRLHIFLVVVLMAVAAQGQTHYEGNVAIGGKAGVTLSKLRFNPSVPQTMLLGTMAGVTFRYMEEKHFGLIAELNMEQRGWKEKFEGYDFQYQRRFTYIQLPILTHVYFGNERFHCFFNAGPEVGMMISESTKSNFDYSNWHSVPDFPSANRKTEQYNLSVKSKLDYGISAGLGLELIASNRSSFLLEGRFYYGLRDVFSNHKGDPFSGSSSMSIMVSLGYYYRIK